MRKKNKKENAVKDEEREGEWGQQNDGMEEESRGDSQTSKACVCVCVCERWTR